MAKSKTIVSPLLMHWRYFSLARSHRLIHPNVHLVTSDADNENMVCWCRGNEAMFPVITCHIAYLADKYYGPYHDTLPIWQTNIMAHTMTQCLYGRQILWPIPWQIANITDKYYGPILDTLTIPQTNIMAHSMTNCLYRRQILWPVSWHIADVANKCHGPFHDTLSLSQTNIIAHSMINRLQIL